MKIETLKDRIQNAETKIEKKEATIQKKLEWIAKKEKKMPSFTEQEQRFASWDIENWKDDIERLKKEITEVQKSLETYRKQLTGEIAKEEILLKEIPEAMKRMQTELVEKWDAWDIARRNKVRDARHSMDWHEYTKKFTHADREFSYKTDEQIHSSNVQDAKCLIIDLYYRVKHITGEITDWSDIRAEEGTWGFAVLNGIVIGKEGRCRIESIYAGGYNIQRLHIRVLTHEIR